MARRRSNTVRVTESSIANNFKLIKGIGPIIEQHLQNAGIHTLASLAALSAEEIAALIPSMTAQQVTKRGWITQARKLMLDKAKSKTHQKKTTISASRQHYENFTFEFLLNEKNKTRRLRVVHVQSGDVDTWAKWDAERLIDFLAHHTGSSLPYATSAIPNPIKPKLTSCQSVLNEPRSNALTKTTLIPSVGLVKDTADFPSSLASESISQIPASADNMTKETVHQQGSSAQAITRSINKIRLLEWKFLLGNTDQPLGNLIADQAFDLNLILELNIVSLSTISHLEFTGTLFAKKLSVGQRLVLSETNGVVPYAKIVKLTISNASLSRGIYRLEALVTLTLAEMESMRQPGPIAFLDGGLLQVY